MTLVYAYYENGKMLDYQLDSWDRYNNKDKFKIIIVDDGSVKDPAENHLKDVDVGIDIELYKIHEDIPWNQDGARNLGMTRVEGWCLMTDIDHVLTYDNADKILNYDYDKQFYYTLGEKEVHYILNVKTILNRPPHPNTYIIHKDTFWKTGGYNENYRGYYGTDVFFSNDLKLISKHKHLDFAHLFEIGINVISDSCTQNYGRQGSEYCINNAKGYMTGFKGPLNFKWTRVK